ncbi:MULTISPECIES: bifunctional methylenetetrahydrofolate dehydrogenase/methenyltetrahydrofolate cyclohydrolase FolD [Nitrosomonas]|uniref:Bifunctional protein FolD n=1 Tax=Nitrosomonas communis TaxID=44574 RepID=A0A0F7KIQ9_9PROT|nr:MULTISPECIES: bifunctional methylenetetrahydrofolate dehydrogenase/methenyltetrahydrofolate cyclohydrolase FolD [Nitrosomonas]AKH38819.1 methenyltetrahydrofolate cyclohydrolase [Nitrosomonas communis]TYP88789.1 methylenetetrahydrofolate dehydrogenase (NADP+)/methenyltetrahydrofolate cyclohydrolase [Nitrosomonas communis]UVS60931.1 bifunctional methylenetetrahydrofolate dehydrogenase/methenyltetrahydrofolate cyclohydrolase FolD [Nitrosomonas sp. PLL12]
MSADIIDGNTIARKIRAELKIRAENLAKEGIQPGLAVILVGDDPASGIYVRNKAKACRESGIRSEVYNFPGKTSQETVLQQIHVLNANPEIHGILVQLPLPRHFESHRIIAAIAIEKDVDGFHPCNVGALVTGNALFFPCTPYGVMMMLKEHEVLIEGQHAVVVGRSNIVGKPMSLMLLEKGATVTICSSKTRNLAEHTRNADILVVATGKPRMIMAEMVKSGATIIDVGINRMEDGTLCGDVDFMSIKEKAGYITPVPGGVGPMTITMLMSNTIEAAERARAVM